MGGCFRVGVSGVEADGDFGLLGSGGQREFDVGLLLVGEGGHGVEIDGSVVAEGEGHAVGGDGEVLAGGLDGDAVEMQELIAVGGLEDVDGLAADLAGGDVAEASQVRIDDEAADGEASGGCGKGEGGPEGCFVEALLPHLGTEEVKGGEAAGIASAAAAEDDELCLTDEGGEGMAGGVEEGKLVDLAGVGVDVEGPGLRAVAEGRDEAGAVDREDDRISRDGRACEARKNAAGVLRIEGEAIEHDLNVWRGV